MSVTYNAIHRSSAKDIIDSRDSAQKDIRNRTHPWGINPLTHLEQVRQQSRINKLLTLQESLTDMTQSSSANKNQEHLQEIVSISENLKTLRSTLFTLNESDIESATRYGKEIMIITTDLLFRVVNQIGQTNVLTPTFESMLAYIRGLMHTRSAHMRQTIPGPLLITWYELSQLMSVMQNEPELKITNKKAMQLLVTAQNTAAWAYKHLASERLDNEHIGFIDRSSIPYTYE